MKVSLDLEQLHKDGKISREELDRLVGLAIDDAPEPETKRAYWIAVVMAIIAVVAGFVGMFPDFFNELRKALIALVGPRGAHLLAIAASGAGALATGSGFLAASCALLLMTFVGNTGTFYTHASYYVAVEEPAITAAVFSGMAWCAFRASEALEGKQARAALIFSRTCVFIVNLAFWVGSLWGDKALGKGSDVPFVVGWAMALLAVGVWAAQNERRWLVNTTAVFGSIHFYTQWFERLGASPGSLFGAGAFALAILLELRRYNAAAKKAAR